MAAKKRCTVICAAPEQDLEFIGSAVRESDFLVCADGGCDVLSRIDIIPDLIIGDFDSAESNDVFPLSERITLDTHKDDTDTMYCVKECMTRGYREFLFLGATGGRTDHLLANLSILLYLGNHGAHGVIRDKYNDIMMLDIGDNVINVDQGTTISVIPFGSAFAELSYKGLYYPLSHTKVTVEYPYTISNESCGDEVVITLHSGSALLFIVNNIGG
ncbi:MAG: thiamine diphosphokinase [Clostridia bacterium]|nr:thiamine diphosphokinase [Clostridia bacterium]